MKKNTQDITTEKLRKDMDDFVDMQKELLAQDIANYKIRQKHYENTYVVS